MKDRFSSKKHSRTEAISFFFSSTLLQLGERRVVCGKVSSGGDRDPGGSGGTEILEVVAAGTEILEVMVWTEILEVMAGTEILEVVAAGTEILEVMAGTESPVSYTHLTLPTRR